MNAHAFDFRGARLHALPSGALYWPEHALLTVSDLHFGKSARLSAIGGAALPPYEVQDTLTRLDADLQTTQARQVICLGDSFDTPQIDAILPEPVRLWITRLQAGRDWIWIEGNHDPGPVSLGGTHRAEIRLGPLTFRHISRPEGEGEISGHYHPKAKLVTRGRALSRPCFLVDKSRLILPAYGTYTGGLFCNRAPLTQIMGQEAIAILTGRQAHAIPMPRTRV